MPKWRVLGLLAVCALAICVLSGKLQNFRGFAAAERSYFNSPDDRYTFEVTRRSGGIGSISTSVGVGLTNLHGETEFEEVFWGSSVAYPIVYWSEPNTLMILLCRGYINKMKSRHYLIKGDSNSKVYIQAITAPRIRLDDRLVCDFDPVTGYFANEALEPRRPLH